MNNTSQLLIDVYPHSGYAPDQVAGTTLAELRDLIEQAIDEYGEDAEVITYDGSQRYGAKYGRLSVNEVDAIRPANDDEDADVE